MTWLKGFIAGIYSFSQVVDPDNKYMIHHLINMSVIFAIVILSMIIQKTVLVSSPKNPILLVYTWVKLIHWTYFVIVLVLDNKCTLTKCTGINIGVLYAVCALVSFFELYLHFVDMSFFLRARNGEFLLR